MRGYDDYLNALGIPTHTYVAIAMLLLIIVGLVMAATKR
jgi:hypothetical protein